MGGDTWQPLGPGLSPYTCSLCAHQPVSLCPPPTAALWPSWRRRRWPTGHLHSSELSDNFSPATAAQLCPTLASWGSEPSPGAAAVIYKANFIKFVTIPWFPCREGHPLAAWLCQAQDCLPGLFTNETTLSIPRGGAPACMASRGQQSAGPAGKGQFTHPGGGGGGSKRLPGWETGEGWARHPLGLSHAPSCPTDASNTCTLQEARTPASQTWPPLGWDRPPRPSGPPPLKHHLAGPAAVRGTAPLTQPPPRLRLGTDQHSRRAGVGGGLAPEVEVL